jgi:hypothetical protein
MLATASRRVRPAHLCSAVGESADYGSGFVGLEDLRPWPARS